MAERRSLKTDTQKLSSAPRQFAAEPPAQISTYERVPRHIRPEVIQTLPRWRVRFEILGEPGKAFALEIYDDVVLGRGGNSPNLIDLSYFDAVKLGISRRHALLRPTADKLFVIDLESTNGTRLNGYVIGPNTPYALRSDEILELGALQLSVQIVEYPRGEVATVSKRADLTGAVTEAAKAITSRLDLDQVAEQTVESTMLLTTADAVAVWVIDEQSHQLKLISQQGFVLSSTNAMYLSPSNPLVSKVINEGEAVHIGAGGDNAQIKIQTGFLVEALLLLPIKLGGVTLGVLGAFQLTQYGSFAESDQRVLESVAEFTSIAIQNTRLYRAVNRALVSRSREIAAVNQLASTVAESLEFDHIHHVLVTELGRHWNVDDVILWLHDSYTSSYQPQLEQRAIQHLIETSGDQVFKIVENVAHSAEPIITDFNVTEERMHEGRLEVSKVQGKSIACVPLKIQNEVIAIITLVHEQQGRFDPYDLVRLQAFTIPVAAVIRNAQLHVQARRERAIMNAIVRSMTQPVFILNQRAEIVSVNESGRHLLEDYQYELIAALTYTMEHYIEVGLGDDLYSATLEQVNDVGKIIVMYNLTHTSQAR